jgi:antitoxin component of RelBE/YafQ-DinJ toxin-antitoxin module
MDTATKTRAKKAEETELLVWNIPRDVKAKFKAYCASRGLTIREAIIQLMKKVGTFV